MNQNLGVGGDINEACRGRALLDRIKDGQTEGRIGGESVESGRARAWPSALPRVSGSVLSAWPP